MAAVADTRTCQICERACKVVRGKISLHGYNRPGHGFITGRCWGAQELSWEQDSGVLAHYVDVLRGRLADARKAVEYYTNPALMEVTEHVVPRAAPPYTITYKRGERQATEWGGSVDGFASTVADRTRRLESEIAGLTREIERQAARLAGWAPTEA